MSKSLEVRVDDYVLSKLKESNLNYYQENDIPKNYERALENASKHGSGTGRPDFCVAVNTDHRLAVVIENKWGLNRFENVSRGKFTMTSKAVREYAVNGALHYAFSMVESNEFDEVIAIAVAGEGETVFLI